MPRNLKLTTPTGLHCFSCSVLHNEGNVLGEKVEGKGVGQKKTLKQHLEHHRKLKVSSESKEMKLFWFSQILKD